MAHEIETHGAQAAAIFARDDAWHRLGTTLPNVFTAEQAMTVGHLGQWNVRKTPLTTSDLTDAGATSLEVPDRYATVRTNPFTGDPDVLGVVGPGYLPIQNEEHCQILNRLVDESGAIFDTAGSLRGGRQVFVSLRLPASMRIGGVDEVRTNIAALNSHDGSAAFRLLVTPVRVVCANTQAAALAHHCASVSIRHTRNARATIATAREALGLTFAYITEFQAQAEQMIDQTMTDEAFTRLVADVFGPADTDAPPRTLHTARKRSATLSYLWHDAPTQAEVRGTRWAGYQVITEYVDHYAPVRTRGDKATARAQRILTSDEPNRIKHHTWQLCTA